MTGSISIPTDLNLFGFIGPFTPMELLIILIVALVVLGPERLPDVARGAGRMVHKLKVLTENLQGEMKDVVDDPSMKPIRDITEFAARPREKLAEYAAEAEAEARQAALEKQKASDGSAVDSPTEEKSAPHESDEQQSTDPPLAEETSEIVELPEGYVADPTRFEAPPLSGEGLSNSDGDEQPNHGFYEPPAPPKPDAETE